MLLFRRKGLVLIAFVMWQEKDVYRIEYLLYSQKKPAIFRLKFERMSLYVENTYDKRGCKEN
jgi:hypothetical protein